MLAPWHCRLAVRVRCGLLFQIGRIYIWQLVYLLRNHRLESQVPSGVLYPEYFGLHRGYICLRIIL